MTTFNVYRRQTVDDIPVAIATGLTSQDYSDATAVNGESYLYSIGAIKEGVEKIGSEIKIKAGGDLYWDDVIFYARFNSSAIDLSNYKNSPTLGSGVNYSPAKFGNGLSCNDSQSTAVSYPSENFGFAENEDFTIECWFSSYNKPSFYWDSILGTWGASLGWCFFLTHTGGICFNFEAQALSYAITYEINTLYSAALVRKDGIIYAFFRGILLGTVAFTSAIAARPFYVGGNGLSTDWLNGVVDEVRITKGIARYTTDYTPQTTEFFTY